MKKGAPKDADSYGPPGGVKMDESNAKYWNSKDPNSRKRYEKLLGK